MLRWARAQGCEWGTCDVEAFDGTEEVVRVDVHFGSPHEAALFAATRSQVIYVPCDAALALPLVYVVKLHRDETAHRANTNVVYDELDSQLLDQLKERLPNPRVDWDTVRLEALRLTKRAKVE